MKIGKRSAIPMHKTMKNIEKVRQLYKLDDGSQASIRPTVVLRMVAHDLEGEFY